MTTREEFLKKIRATFKIEAGEGIANITNNLIELEKEPPEPLGAKLIESIYRDAHSLKGAARAVNVVEIETICQALESVFSALKEKSIFPVPQLFDLFHLTVNTLTEILGVGDEGVSDSLRIQVTDLVENLLKVEAGGINDTKNTRTETPVITVPIVDKIGQKPRDPEPPLLKESGIPRHDLTIRISVEKLDNLLAQAEEMIALKQTFDHFGVMVRSTAKKLNSWTHEAYEVSTPLDDIKQKLQEKLKGEPHSQFEENVSKIVGFFDWASSVVKVVENDLDKLRKFSSQETYNSGAKIESFLNEVKKMISVPFATILDVFPKAARDLAKDLGKEVEVVIRGEDIEIDRRILEEIRNPMMHLLRNSIDHGIENPGSRKLKGKREKGTIKLEISRQENNMIEIMISDDGGGIDLDKVRRKYIKQEKVPVSEVDQISDSVLLNYIFKSGLSTTEMITDLSGRGLGLAIVQEKIEQLGGFVVAETVSGQGTSFRIQIPLTLVTFRGVRIRVGDREFITPTSQIERVLRIGKTSIKPVGNKPTIPYNGGLIPLVYLADILEFSFNESDDQHVLVVVFGSADQVIGFVVDEIVDEEVVLVKKFNSQLKRVRNIAGATVLGSGKVIPILHVGDLLKSAIKGSASPSRRNIADKEKELKAILVVEDSITSRMLLKNILETAGYRVATAIDGIDGYTKLKEEPFSLVVSDVDMPRMNGLDMTARIRSDKTVGDIPVVLVTSLSKREDRERGMEVGANAYIVKSSFDQSNLLEVIERLLN